MTERKLNPKQRPNYYYLLDGPDVKRWYDNVVRRSVVTAAVWLRRMGFVHKSFWKTPKELAEMTPRKLRTS